MCTLQEPVSQAPQAEIRDEVARHLGSAEGKCACTRPRLLSRPAWEASSRDRHYTASRPLGSSSEFLLSCASGVVIAAQVSILVVQQPDAQTRIRDKLGRLIQETHRLTRGEAHVAGAADHLLVRLIWHGVSA